MKKPILFIIIFTIIEMGFRNSKTITIEMEFIALEIIKPDTSFLNIIDRHIFVMKKSNIKTHKNKIIIMKIIKGLSVTDGIPKYVVDSMYSTNDFGTGSKRILYPPKYICSLQTDFVVSAKAYISGYKSVFYYKYNEWDVVIVSDLMIKMSYVSRPKKIIIESKMTMKKGETVKSLTNNRTVFSFYGGFLFPNEIIAIPIKKNNKHKLDYCNEKSRIKWRSL